MKNNIWLLILVCGLGQAALAGVVSSPHNLVGNANFGNPQEVCSTCHVPHSSSTAFLGNRTPANVNITFYSGQVGLPSNSSAICMSCHDGSLAPSVGSATDYSHSHPFSADYPVKTGYATPVSGSITGSFGTVKLEGVSKNKIECGTCHNPHEPGASGKFLMIENTHSNLCLTCHQK